MIDAYLRSPPPEPQPPIPSPSDQIEIKASFEPVAYLQKFVKITNHGCEYLHRKVAQTRLCIEHAPFHPVETRDPPENIYYATHFKRRE
jgi:hypothetical protein